MNLEEWSRWFLGIAFVLYVLAFMLFFISVAGKKWSKREPQAHMKKWSMRGFWLTVIGWLCQVGYVITRWIELGNLPVSNMFEFMTFLTLMVIFSFMVLFLIYRSPILGIFSVPVGIIIVAYASVFPTEVQPLIPALNTHWLKIHVTTAAAGEAFFAIGFAAGIMYLLRTVDFTARSGKALWEKRGVEFTMFSILVVIGFIGVSLAFQAAGYKAEFLHTATIMVEQDVYEEAETVETYTIPPIVAPHDSEFLNSDGKTWSSALFEAPSWMKGVNAGRKFNTMIWSVLAGALMYGLLRLIFRKPIGAAIQPIMNDMDAEDLDEISYRAIAIGFPIFTLGALIFAMIWAHYAWGRFWAWDPKEVWALITWLFYSVYLHLRLSRGWQGSGSAWLAVIGFLIVMFTLVGVNLLLAGLHAYAGVD